MTFDLRTATAGDATALFTWVNSPDCLANKRHTSEPVSWDDHVAWLERLLNNPAARLWIVERDAVPVGQVRFAPDASGARAVDIYIVPAARGGTARQALQQALRLAAEIWPGQTVEAEVMAHNVASHRLFSRLGFVVADVTTISTRYRIMPGGDMND